MVRLSVPAAALSLGIRLCRRIRWRGRFRHHRRDSGHVRRTDGIGRQRRYGNGRRVVGLKRVVERRFRLHHRRARLHRQSRRDDGIGPNHSFREAESAPQIFVHERSRKPPAQLDWDDLGVTTISTFLNHLESDRHNSVRTRNLRLTAIRSQFSFAALVTPSTPAHPALTAESLGRGLAEGLQGHAGQRGAISEQSVLDLEIAGGGVCRAGLLVIEIAAGHPGVWIRADGQPCLGHRGE